ncbi:FeoB-associated Cys-rich membrane protein [Staphylococcus taiwanensis]|nr:FeoB-associated Cys-rich membrane protein [Staphylococcus taiwanensis]
MYIIINAILLIAIIGYTLFTLVKFFKRAKRGDCGSCKSECHCAVDSTKKVHTDIRNHLKK